MVISDFHAEDLGSVAVMGIDLPEGAEIVGAVRATATINGRLAVCVSPYNRGAARDYTTEERIDLCKPDILEQLERLAASQEGL